MKRGLVVEIGFVPTRRPGVLGAAARRPRGAARVARVLVGLGVPVQVVGVVGDDPAGREMLGLLKNMASALTGWWWTPIVPPP